MLLHHVLVARCPGPRLQRQSPPFTRQRSSRERSREPAPPPCCEHTMGTWASKGVSGGGRVPVLNFNRDVRLALLQPLWARQNTQVLEKLTAGFCSELGVPLQKEEKRGQQQKNSQAHPQDFPWARNKGWQAKGSCQHARLPVQYQMVTGLGRGRCWGKPPFLASTQRAPQASGPCRALLSSSCPDVTFHYYTVPAGREMRHPCKSAQGSGIYLSHRLLFQD